MKLQQPKTARSAHKVLHPTETLEDEEDIDNKVLPRPNQTRFFIVEDECCDYAIK